MANRKSMEVFNPFTPESSEELFINREEELSMAKEYLLYGGSSLGIIGPRAIGKTSFVQKLLSELDKNEGFLHVTVYAHSGSDSVFHDIAAHLLEIFSSRIEGFPEKAIISKFSDYKSPRAKFALSEKMNEHDSISEGYDMIPIILAILKEANNKIKATKIIIVLEELDQIRKRDSIARFLKHLADSFPNVSVICVGTFGGARDIFPQNNSIIRLLNVIYLSTLTLKDSVNFFQKRSVYAGYSFSSKFVDKAASFSGGHPFILQLIGYAAVQLALELGISNNTIDDNFLDISLKKAASLRPEASIFSNVIKNKGQKEIILAILRSEKGELSQQEIGDHISSRFFLERNIRDLINNDILYFREGRLCIKSPLTRLAFIEEILNNKVNK